MKLADDAERLLLPVTVSSQPRGVRGRLARDLHDGVGQSLNALLVEIRVAMDRGQASVDDLLIMEREAESTLRAVRALAYQVRRPVSLVDPLAEAQRYGERLLRASGAALRWVDQRATRRLSPRVARELAWTIRELVTNALKHGVASLVEVTLSDAEDRIRVSVRDDGVGFQSESLHPTAEGRGLGLLGNAERMASIGGILTIRSRPGEGTVIIVDAPRFLRNRLTARPSSSSISAALEMLPAVVA